MNHRYQYGLCGNLAHGYQHGPRWQHKPRTFMWPLGVTWTTDINVPTSCSRSIDPNVSLCGPQTTNVNMTTASLTMFQGVHRKPKLGLFLFFVCFVLFLWPACLSLSAECDKWPWTVIGSTPRLILWSHRPRSRCLPWGQTLKPSICFEQQLCPFCFLLILL